jgi:hypothetical protein
MGTLMNGTQLTAVGRNRFIAPLADADGIAPFGEADGAIKRLRPTTGTMQ